ncbi:MAG: P-loop NTPase fold protein [Clostridia bacterium]
MEELVESILDYIRSDYTDYAIMINGEWGSGKTYFWNNKIRKQIDSLRLNGKQYTTIYMSLYGISNLEEISKKIFIETTQLMDKNLKKYMNATGQLSIPEYAKTGLDMANLFGVTQNGDKIDYAKFFSTDDKVLCFDDLERANVDVIDILGYINNFVEHDHIKTIIICNEKELSTKLKNSNLEMKTFIATYLLDKEDNLLKTDKPMVEKIRDKIEYVFDKANEYERIKEKLIGETFEYQPEFNYIINGILMRYENNPDLIKFLKENTNYIITTFNRSGTRNLRILKHALNDFSKIFEMVNKNYPNTNYRVLQTMLIFTIAISFEIKAGKITKDKFVNIKDNEEYKSILVSSRILMDNRQFYIREFDNNYYYNFKVEYRFFKFIEMYVRTRIFDMKTFKKNMEVIINTIDTEKLPGYKRLITEEYWKISDDQFPGVVEDVLASVKKGEIELIDMVKLFIYFSYFVEKKLIEYDIKTIKNIFFEGMNIASLKGTYYPNAKEELDEILEEKQNSNILEIVNHFHSINEMLRDKMYKEQAEDLFKCIPMKMDNFYEKFDREAMNKPVFKYYDMHQMFQRISCASNEDIVQIKEKLTERAKKNKEVVKLEIPNLISLKQIINEYIKGKAINIKIVMLEEFAKQLDEIIKENS